MDWFLTHAWIIPALPALGFVLILLFGKRFLGPTRAHWIGVPLIAVAFVLSICTGVAWIQHTNDPHGGPLADVQEECSRTVQATGSEEPAEHADEGPTEGHAAARGRSVAQEDHGTEATTTQEGGEEHAEAEKHHDTQPVVRCVSWFDTGDHSFTIGTLVDGQAVMLLFVVTLISLLVHLYSTDYVNGDRRYTHYYAFLSLFTSSMLFFVLAENTLQMMVGWELVGVCSFALIGHWWEEKPNSDAALKAFITNRVGDVGLIVGVIVLFFGAGQSFSIIDINIGANEGLMNHTVLLVASCCLITAVMSKSGQFVLHTWLPDAMAGPTPVSALIHAATMVVAGIYMVGRLYPVFFEGLAIGGSSINLLALVGGVTAVFGALLAFVQKDIKKVLAYSTVSQLGFMVTALGVGAWTAAMFHLFTHAMFKACLFLGAGSLSHASHHSFNMVDDMGGLRRVMPRTYWTYLIGTLALAGIIPFAGFWSKDEILAGTGSANEGVGNYHFALVMLLIGAFCTAAYMTRTIWYAFYNGEYKGHGHPHESGPVITWPLIVLAALTCVIWLVNIPTKFFFDWRPPESFTLKFEHYVEPVGPFFPGSSDNFTHAEFNGWIAALSLLVAGGGLLAGYLFYWKRALKPLENLAEKSRLAAFFKNILVNKYYFDWLYTDVIVHAVKKPIAAAAYWFNQKVLDGVVDGAGKTAVASGRFVYDKIDQGVIDGVVNGTAVVATESGGELRRTQTGRVQQYAALFFAAAAILAGIFVLVIG
ncbi:MAG TPA: NADH-quinone oxidoreductase subunit L [Microthrixaceae bacterium]|nr:NADH-quinone oxidoreductase subunit L [Microthrixaceae bacterium]